MSLPGPLPPHHEALRLHVRQPRREEGEDLVLWRPCSAAPVLGVTVVLCVTGGGGAAGGAGRGQEEDGGGLQQGERSPRGV